MTVRGSGVSEPARPGSLECLLQRPWCIQGAVHQACESDDDAMTPERDELHRLGRTGVEAHNSPRWYRQASPERGPSVEPEPGVGLEEVEVRGDRDRYRGLVGDLDEYHVRIRHSRVASSVGV